MPARPSKLPARLIVVLSSVFLLVLLIHLAGVFALRQIVERQLHPALPVGTYIGDAHLNLFSGVLKIEDFQLRNEGVLSMRFGAIDVAISPWRLLTGQLHVERIDVANGYLRVDRLADGGLDLGLPPLGDSDPAPADAKPAPFSLGGVRLERILVEYHDGDLASALQVHNLKVGAYSARADSQQVPIDAALEWDGRKIGVKAELALGLDGVAARGHLRTDLVDLERTQRLARIKKLVIGETAFDGDFAWQGQELTLAGNLGAPSIRYDIAGRLVRLEDLELPDFDLRLVTAPVLSFELLPGPGAKVRSWQWRTDDQDAAASAVRVIGRWRFEDGRALEVDGLEFSADTLEWSSAGRKASLAGVRLTGALSQPLTDPIGLPSLQLDFAASRLMFTDSDAALDLALGEPGIKGLSLGGGVPGSPGRELRGHLSAADSRIAQADSVVRWAALDADLQGIVGGAEMQMTANLTLGDLELANPALATGPLVIQRIVGEGLELGSSSRFARLRFEDVRLPGERPETGLRIVALDLPEGRYSAADGLSLGEIVIDGLQTGVVRDKTGQWRHVASAIRRDADPKRPADEDAAPAWRIAGLKMTGDSYIDTADYMNPDMSKPRFRIERLQLGALASDAPGRKTPFGVSLRPDRYSEFVIDGTLRPLDEAFYIDAKGHLHGFGLTSVNGLIADGLGHRFRGGQLDDDFRITIENQRLDMKNGMRLAGIEVETIPDKSGPPLGTAIALLEDRDGNIKVDVPVAGNLADPKFSVLGALNPIIMKAVAGSAALAIQPLGSVLLVGGLLANQALKVTFEPAVFDPYSSELNPAARSYLAKLGAKLAEKPKLAVRVCGVVVVSERRKDKQGGYLDDEDELLAMAQRRADAARAYLAEKGAGDKQLRVCRPALDAAPEGLPRVDIAL